MDEAAQERRLQALRHGRTGTGNNLEIRRFREVGKL
jgi:hypothetical protein